MKDFTKKELASFDKIFSKIFEFFDFPMPKVPVAETTLEKAIKDWIKQHDKRLIEEIKKRLPSEVKDLHKDLNKNFIFGWDKCLSEIKQLLK